MFLSKLQFIGVNRTKLKEKKPDSFAFQFRIYSKPYQARPFQSFGWTGGGRGGGLRGPDAKNQGYDELIRMKLCMSHYSHKSMPDAKCECGSFSIFGDMTSQSSPLEKGIYFDSLVIKFGYLPTENGFNF